MCLRTENLMAKPPSSAQVQVNFRMPADLKARIEAVAAEHSRSTTAEIVATLEAAYPAPVVSGLDLAGAIDRLPSDNREEIKRIIRAMLEKQ